jgi:general secretion pathway protein L
MALTLGIDIGKHSVRGAVLKTGMRSAELERFIEVPISALDPNTPHQNLVEAALGELVAQLGAAPDNVVAAIDGAHASVRIVSIPAAAKKRAAEVLPFELESLLPFPVDEAIVDYQEVRTDGTEVALLAAAVPDLVVAETLESLAQVDLSPRELAVGGAALDGLAPFIQQPADEAWLLLHLESEWSDVCVLRAGACELARTLDEGRESLRERPAAFRNAFLQTVMKYRAEGGPRLDRVVVMGLGSDDPAVLSALGQGLDVPCESLVVPVTKEGATSPAPIFGRALALAGRITRRGKRIDMRKGRYALPGGVSQLREYALLAVCCVLALVFSYTFRVWAEYRVLGDERDALQEKLSSVTERHFGEATTSPKRARELLEGGGVNKDPLPRFDAMRALGAISSAVPPSVVHDTRKLEITLDETGQTGSFELQGQIPDLSARDQVADALDAHDCIEQLERGKTSTVPGQERKNYTLSGTIACPGAARPKGSKGSQVARGGR